MAKIVISFQNVSFSYSNAPLLSNVNFEVFENEFIGLIGPNGSGKTTALNLIMGFLKPTNGEVCTFFSNSNKDRQKIGYVPQSAHFDPQFPLSVFDLVLMGLTAKLPWWGKVTTEQKAMAEKALEKVGMLSLKEHSFGTLSGGQKQRALIARALADEPELLLLDEPTANIFPKEEEGIFKLLSQFKKSMTILLVTHNFEALLKSVERVLCFQHEVISLVPEEVCDHFAMGLYHPPLSRKHLHD